MGNNPHFRVGCRITHGEKEVTHLISCTCSYTFWSQVSTFQQLGLMERQHFLSLIFYQEATKKIIILWNLFFCQARGKWRKQRKKYDAFNAKMNGVVHARHAAAAVEGIHPVLAVAARASACAKIIPTVTCTCRFQYSCQNKL